jgi:hypothetical protein
MSRSSRRHFAKSLAVAAAAIPLTTTDAFAQTPPQPAPPPSPLAKALTGVVRAQHGRHLSEDELKRIEKDFSDYLPYLDGAREFKLVNSDEPDFTFSSLTKR